MPYLFLLLLILTALSWLFYKLGLLKTCPVCVAALITWVAGVILLYTGSSFSNPLFISILMGLTLGAYAEKLGARFGFIWKTLWIILGAGGIYFLLMGEPLKASLLLGLTALATFIFRSPPAGAKVLVDRFRDCC